MQLNTYPWLPRFPKFKLFLGQWAPYLFLSAFTGISVLCSGCSTQAKIPHVPGRHEIREHGPIIIQLTGKQEKTIGIETQPAAYERFNLSTELHAKVEAVNELSRHVYSPVAGKAVDVLVSLGQSVQTGQTLAVIKSDAVGQIQMELLQEYLQLEADLKQAKVQVAFSKSAYDREKMLYDEKVSARMDMEAARTQYEKDNVFIQTLKSKQTALIQTYEERLRLYGMPAGTAASVVKSRHIQPLIALTAPRSGCLVTRNINSGELVDPSKELFAIADLSQVWLVGDVYEKDIAKIRHGQAVDVRVDGLGNRLFKGKVTFVGSILDPQTRTLDLRANVLNPGLILKPNMFAHMSIQTDSLKAITVPKSAIQRNGDFTFVYVLTGPHRYEERRVDLGKTDTNKVQVLSGLKPGESVAVKGTLSLKGEALKLSGGIR